MYVRSAESLAYVDGLPAPALALVGADGACVACKCTQIFVRTVSSVLY